MSFYGKSAWRPVAKWSLQQPGIPVTPTSSMYTSAYFDPYNDNPDTPEMSENGDILIKGDAFYTCKLNINTSDWAYNDQMSVTLKYIPVNPKSTSVALDVIVLNLDQCNKEKYGLQSLTMRKGDILRLVFTPRVALIGNVVDIPTSVLKIEDTTSFFDTGYTTSGLDGIPRSIVGQPQMHFAVTTANALGECTFILSEDGTATGTPLFSKIYNIQLTPGDVSSVLFSDVREVRCHGPPGQPVSVFIIGQRYRLTS